MINHIRTLLMNVNGSDVVPPWSLAEQYVPTEYLALKLPTNLTAIRSRLFGGRPDRIMMNYRMAQILPLIHATELAEFVYAKDPRVTYLPFGSDLFPSTAFGLQLLLASGGTPAITGAGAAPDMSGRVYRSYNINSTSDAATITQLTPPAGQIEYNLTYTDGLSDQTVSLYDSGYFVAMPPEAAASIDVLLRPQWELGDILASFDSIGEPMLDALFGITNVEPYQTFSNLFYDHDEMAYRLGGLVLALAWRSDEVRQGGTGSGVNT